MILTAVFTGLRLGELLSLRWKDIDLEGGVIYLPSSKTMKDTTGRGQKVVMQHELIDLFRGLPDRSEWVFCSGDGSPYIRDHVYGPFKKLLESLRIDPKKYSWKELRHTTATLMKLKGAEISSIKDQLRHTSIRTTENFYIGSDIGFQREQNERLSFSGRKMVENEASKENANVATA